MAKRYYLAFGTQISRLRVHWLTGAPLLFLVHDLLVPPPLPSFDFPRPHQEGDASKLRAALVQIQNHLELASCPHLPKFRTDRTGHGEPQGPSELERRAVMVSGDRGRWGWCRDDSCESPRGPVDAAPSRDVHCIPG